MDAGADLFVGGGRAICQRRRRRLPVSEVDLLFVRGMGVVCQRFVCQRCLHRHGMLRSLDAMAAALFLGGERDVHQMRLFCLLVGIICQRRQRNFSEESALSKLALSFLKP